MFQIHASQIKAARAILDWSQEELARAAGLAVSTVRNLETGFIPRGRTTEAIRQTIEKAGLEFIEPQGVRRRVDEVIILEGPDCCEILSEDISATVRKTGGDIISVMKSSKTLVQTCSSVFSGKTNRSHTTDFFADVLCLLPKTEGSLPVSPQLRCRGLTTEQLGPVSYLLYGNRHVMISHEGEESFRFIMFKSSPIVYSYRAHFLALWEMASPLGRRL